MNILITLCLCTMYAALCRKNCSAMADLPGTGEKLGRTGARALAVFFGGAVVGLFILPFFVLAHFPNKGVPELVSFMGLWMMWVLPVMLPRRMPETNKAHMKKSASNSKVRGAMTSMAFQTA